MRTIKQLTSTFAWVPRLHQVDCVGVRGRDHLVAAQQRFRNLSCPRLTSDSPIPSSMQLHYSPKKLKNFQENKLKCLGINLTGLTVMPMHDSEAVMHGGAAAIHVGVGRHVPALQVPSSQDGRCRCRLVSRGDRTPMRGT